MLIREFVRKIADSASTYPDGVFVTGERRVYTCVNPFSYHLVRRHKELYESMDGLFVDGMTMCLLIRMLWGKRVPRLSFDMSGMAVDLFDRLNNNDETIYFVGAKQDALEATIGQIKKAYPNIHIAGYRNGYFLLPEDRQREIEHIVSLNPDFVIVGMGSPIQEQFAIDLRESGYKGIVFTCGGFLHQTANGINYYPEWVNRYNLRAFYRLFHEKGLWGRLYNVIIEFPILFSWDTLCSRLSRSKR